MMNRRTVLGLAGFGPLSACSYPPHFGIAWDEEVGLYDGRVIIVSWHFTYERLDRSAKYERSILRDTTLTFDSGPPLGQVSQLFKRMRPVSLDQHQGIWYSVIETRGAGGSPAITGQDWGPMQNAQGQRTIKLTTSGFVPIPISDFPSHLVKFNLLREYGPVGELALFDKHLLRLHEKSVYSASHPVHPDLAQLARPRHASFK